MSRQNWTDRSARSQTMKHCDPLTDKRYEEMLKSASSFFAAAEGHSVAERHAVIQDINVLMERYGLTVDDLR